MRPDHEVIAVGALDTMLKPYLELFSGREVTKLVAFGWRYRGPMAELVAGDDGSHIVAVTSPAGIMAIHRYRTTEAPTRDRVIADNAALFSGPDARLLRGSTVTGEWLVALMRQAPQA